MSNRKVLADLFNEIIDPERDLYELYRNKIKSGIKFSLKCKGLKFETEKVNLYQLIKYHVNLFKLSQQSSSHYLGRRHHNVNTLRGNLDKVPLFMDEEYKVEISCQKEIYIKYEGPLSGDFFSNLTVNPSMDFLNKLLDHRELMVEIVLLKEGETHKILEEDIFNPRKFLSQGPLQGTKDKLVTFRRMQKQTLQNRARLLGYDLKKDDVTEIFNKLVVDQLTVSVIENLSKDFLTIRNIIENFPKIISNESLVRDSKSLKEYRDQIKEHILLLEQDGILQVNKSAGVDVPLAEGSSNNPI